MSDSVADVGRPRAASLSRNIKRVRTLEPGPVSKLSPAPNTSTFPRTQTIDIREPDRPVHRGGAHSTAIPHIGAGLGDGMRRRTTGVALERSMRLVTALESKNADLSCNSCFETSRGRSCQGQYWRLPTDSNASDCYDTGLWWISEPRQICSYRGKR